MSIEDKIAEVLAEHQEDLRPGLITVGGNPACTCGWAAWKEPGTLAAHQAAMLTPLVREARVEALREAANDASASDPSEHPFLGLDEMTSWLRARADRTEKEA